MKERTLREEFLSIYGWHFKRPIKIRDGHEYATSCGIDGSITINAEFAKIMIEAFRKDQDGGFFIMDHERGHYEKGQALSIKSADDPSKQFRKGCSEREATLYALRRTWKGKDEFASSIAMLAKFKTKGDSIEIGQQLRPLTPEALKKYAEFVTRLHGLDESTIGNMEKLQNKVIEKYKQLMN